MFEGSDKKTGGVLKRRHEHKGTGVAPVRPSVRLKYRDKTIHRRYELKYRISESTAHAIAHYIRPFIEPDVYSLDEPDGQYSIASLYFDSDSLSLARDTLEGRKNRFKLRIRAYNDDPAVPRFFEIKRRSNTVIFKTRAAVKQNCITDIVNRQLIPSYTTDKQKEVLRQFQLYAYSLNVRPMIIIKYKRQAFEGRFGNRVRITFDRNLCHMPADDLNFKINSSRYQPLMTNFVILEIKFTDRYPAWLGDIIRRFNLPLMAMSKYVESLTQACMLGFCAPEIRTYG